MTIATSAILVGGTSSTTGGTSTGFILKGDSQNEARLILDDGSEFAASSIFTLSVKDPVVNSGSPGGYTQQRSTVKVIEPKVLANGNRTTNSINISVSFDPETTDAEKTSMLESGAQLLIQAALDAFWKKQSLG